MRKEDRKGRKNPDRMGSYGYWKGEGDRRGAGEETLMKAKGKKQ